MESTGRPGIPIGRLGRLGRRTTVLLAFVAFVAACSNQAGGNPTTSPATQAAPSGGASQPGAASQPPAASQPASGGTVALSRASDSELGDYVAGTDGMALYVFLPDKGKDTSQCTGDCAGNWPPLTVDDAADVTADDGVTGELGTVARDDGSLQVTLGGDPLYHYVADQTAGDVKGQGVNDVWYLASAAGKPVGDDDEPSAEQTPCGARYCY
jgi:predicted lipoprotein with Yx(FWY)xxD motif